MYHIVLPHGGSPSDLIESIKHGLTQYPVGCEKVVVRLSFLKNMKKDLQKIMSENDELGMNE